MGKVATSLLQMASQTHSLQLKLGCAACLLTIKKACLLNCRQAFYEQLVKTYLERYWLM